MTTLRYLISIYNNFIARQQLFCVHIVLRWPNIIDQQLYSVLNRIQLIFKWVFHMSIGSSELHSYGRSRKENIGFMALLLYLVHIMI